MRGAVRRRSGSPTEGASRRGATLIELLISVLLVAFVLAATARLYDVGQRQQRLAISYSRVQADIREVLRRVARGIRHARAVIAVSAEASFPVASSGAGQVIVDVPEPSGAPTQWIQIRYHLSGGVLYGQRADQGAPGVPLTDGVEALAFNYYQARGTTRTAVDASPGAANEVQVRLAARRGSAVTAVTVLVNLRNAIVGAF